MWESGEEGFHFLFCPLLYGLNFLTVKTHYFHFIKKKKKEKKKSQHAEFLSVHIHNLKELVSYISRF